MMDHISADVSILKRLVREDKYGDFGVAHIYLSSRRREDLESMVLLLAMDLIVTFDLLLKASKAAKNVD